MLVGASIGHNIDQMQTYITSSIALRLLMCDLQQIVQTDFISVSKLSSLNY